MGSRGRMSSANAPPVLVSSRHSEFERTAHLKREEWIRMQAEKRSRRGKLWALRACLCRGHSSLGHGGRRTRMSSASLPPLCRKGATLACRAELLCRRLDQSRRPLRNSTRARRSLSLLQTQYLSPLYDPVLSSTDEHARRNKALWKEHATFMRSLRQQRQARAKAEFAGASALQRLWRGYLLRRWLKKNRSKMKIRRKMKKSYAKIALKVRLQRRLEEESRRAEQRKGGCCR